MKGIGIYIRGLSAKKHGSPKEAAKKAKDHGVGHVAIMGAWQEEKGGKITQVTANLRRDRWIPYAEAFAAAGIDVGFWFYPWAGGEKMVLDALEEALTKGVPVAYLLADPELGYKWKGRAHRRGPIGMRGQGEAIKRRAAEGTRSARIKAATALMMGLHRLRTEYGAAMGLTSYGMAKYHPNFPWAPFVLGCDLLSPQLYSVSPEQVDAGIEQWWKLHEQRGQVLMSPSVPLFGKNSGAELHHHLSSFVDGNEDIDGFIAWSWRQASRAEWNTLARWSDWLAAGMCRENGIGVPA